MNESKEATFSPFSSPRGITKNQVALLRRYVCKARESRKLREAIAALAALAMQSLILVKLNLLRQSSQSAALFDDKWRFIAYSIAQVSLQGEWCEFGVYRGESLRFIAGQTEATVHGFDSFQGLPEEWAALDRGSFSTHGQLPEVPPNVVFHVGWFEDTVPEYIRKKSPGPIAFAHIDSDLYDSAVTVLKNIEPHLAPGTVLVFDELLGVFSNDEYSALLGELRTKRMRIEWVGFYLHPNWGAGACLRVIGGNAGLGGGPQGQAESERTTIAQVSYFVDSAIGTDGVAEYQGDREVVYDCCSRMPAQLLTPDAIGKHFPRGTLLDLLALRPSVVRS